MRAISARKDETLRAIPAQKDETERLSLGQVDKLLAFKSPYRDEVPEHVSTAIAKMYRELKSNGSIINDFMHTDHPVIPNIFHFVRFV